MAIVTFYRGHPNPPKTTQGAHLGANAIITCNGKLLLEKPDILLLDEPTNYLDEEHISWLKRYLQESFFLKVLLFLFFRH